MEELDAQNKAKAGIDEDIFDTQSASLPEHMRKYVPDKERRKEIIERGISAERPIFDDGLLGKYAKYIEPDEKYYDVVLHGNPNSVEFYGETIDAETLSAIIIQRDDYEKGKAIRLISCCTGQEENGVAQYIADKLNIEVLAPNKTVYAYNYVRDGKRVTTLCVESKVGARDGEWVSFAPNDKEGD